MHSVNILALSKHPVSGSGELYAVGLLKNMLVYLLKKCCRHVIKNVVQILKKMMINGSLKNMLYKNDEKKIRKLNGSHACAQRA